MNLRILIAAFCFAAISPAHGAEPYPTKPVNVAVGFGPGGVNDIAARIISRQLSERLGKAFIVENRPGGGGTIGANMVATAAPDGYTLLLGSVSNIVMTPQEYPRIPYDPVKSFTPVALIGGAPNVLVVNANSPVRTLKDLIALARAKPGMLGYGSAGNGTSNHLTGELFGKAVGINIMHVPYQGDSQALMGLLGGQTEFMFATIPAAIGNIKSGKLRAIAVASPHRSPLAPDVPTFAELGVKNFTVNVWVGILAPAGTPKDIVNKLSNEIIESVKLQSVQQQLSAQGIEAEPVGPAGFSALIKSDMQKWGPVARSAVTAQ